MESCDRGGTEREEEGADDDEASGELLIVIAVGGGVGEGLEESKINNLWRVGDIKSGIERSGSMSSNRSLSLQQQIKQGKQQQKQQNSSLSGERTNVNLTAYEVIVHTPPE